MNQKKMKKTNNVQQIGGDHYSRFKIQPIDVISRANLYWYQGEILKYISRFKLKGGVTDLDKALSICHMLSQKDASIRASLKKNPLNIEMMDFVDDYCYQYKSMISDRAYYILKYVVDILVTNSASDTDISYLIGGIQRIKEICYGKEDNPTN